jgi:hypothetical protein
MSLSLFLLHTHRNFGEGSTEYKKLNFCCSNRPISATMYVHKYVVCLVLINLCKSMLQKVNFAIGSNDRGFKSRPGVRFLGRTTL